MPGLSIKSAEQCRFDAVALGEIMLRLDPGQGRTRTAKSFDVHEGGGEYNVVRALSSVFGHRTGIVTALVDNEVGRLIEGLARSGGVDLSWVMWREFDGVGRAARNGLNFTERGFGVRQPLGMYDRGHSAASQLRADEVDWHHLLADLGVRWLHSGGIQAGLSKVAGEHTLHAVRAARDSGTIVSYDLNFRPGLWREAGGLPAARALNSAIAEHTDVLVGSVGHLAATLTDEVRDQSPGAGLEGFRLVAEQLAERYPSVSVIAATTRVARSAGSHTFGAVAWSRDAGVVESPHWSDLEILDRVGAGDAFAAGVVHGLLAARPLSDSVAVGAALGALTMSTPGDTAIATPAEVEAVAAGDFRFQR